MPSQESCLQVPHVSIMSETTSISITSSKSCVLSGEIKFTTFAIFKLKDHIEIHAENAKGQI